MVKIASMKYKYQDIFSVLVDLEESAKQKDKTSCKNYIKVIKNNIVG